jgi:hypothetical protein
LATSSAFVDTATTFGDGVAAERREQPVAGGVRVGERPERRKAFDATMNRSRRSDRAHSQKSLPTLLTNRNAAFRL